MVDIEGAMERPVEFIEGIATGTKYLVGSIVGGVAEALSKKYAEDQHSEHEGYIAHIDSSTNPSTLFFATTDRRFVFLVRNKSILDQYEIE
ncbi:unnamed protein product [Rotaria sp. Silwood1]|nr:unnamed protein product [Rotaria sp. Silwood1]CAF1418543.1 unnamed protein product [Rotaria sp. Silwood1]CAF3546052.1 unnamed protein product [Rotaria sp. Silwood1]CAF3654504.1 unnamed protein product [Rotaria sp. Silwood1]CAF4636927.1 unnamed protein product [Rotaria sp. Silwood1]